MLLLPLLMPAQQQGFDGFPVLAGAQLLVSQAALDVDGGVEISVCAVAADPTAKRLLVGTVGPVHVVARCYVDTCNLVAHLFVLKAGKCAS